MADSGEAMCSVMPYQFEPTPFSSDNDSLADDVELEAMTGRLGNTDW